MAEETATLETATLETAEAGKETSTDATETKDSGDLIDINEATPKSSPQDVMMKDVWFPDDVKNDPTIKNLLEKSVTDMARMTIAGQKLVGADKFVVPSKDAQPEEWANIYRKLGRPDTADMYNFKQSEDIPAEMYNEELVKEFGAMVFEEGLSARQANRIYQWHQDKAVAGNTAMEEVKEEHLEAGRQALMSEWGNAFQEKCRLANSVLRNTKGGEEFRQALKEKGLGNDPRTIKWLADTVGPTIGEERLMGLDATHSEGRNTPEVAKTKMREMMSKPGYADRYHVEHEALMVEKKQLMKDAYPEDSID